MAPIPLNRKFLFTNEKYYSIEIRDDVREFVCLSVDGWMCIGEKRFNEKKRAIIVQTK